MESLNPKHLILVRHGESEGDVRRAAWKRGEVVKNNKMPEEEELTTRGIDQSHKAGLWIAKNILQRYGLECFDGCFVSTTLRSLQSAIAMDLAGAVWQADSRLDERNRGHIRGLHKTDHERLYPDSYKQMKQNPLHWTPPGGDSIVPDLVGKFSSFYDDIRDMSTVVVVGHRDQMWGAMQPLECLDNDELEAVNTEEIGNAHILWYTSINPATNKPTPYLAWKYSFDPLQPSRTVDWQFLPRVAQRHHSTV